MMLRPIAVASALLIAGLAVAAGSALAQDKIVAKVNGKPILEADVALAEAEIGSELGNLPDSARRRVLVEFLIENQLFAEAAEAEKLGQGVAFESRMQYLRRRALRDTYFEKNIKDGVSEAEAKKFFDAQIAQMKPEQEVKASHILVDSEDKAKDIAAKIGKGADFAQLAKENSKDPGSKDDGGSLGYFTSGQMVPQFDEAAFKLAKGDVSQPIQTQFGWHLIKVEDKRDRPAPEFDAVKDRLVASMMQRKAQEVAAGLRGKASVEYVDADIKKQIDGEKNPAAAPAKK